MSKFSFLVPTRVEFGEGIAKTLPEEVAALQGKRIMIVTDPGLVKIGLVQNFVDMLETEGLTVQVFDEIEANPRDTTCDHGSKVAKEFGADCLVAIGGGSPMDTAKAISLLMTNPGIINQYFGYDMMEHPGIPLITIPTTAGTGSEVTIWAVITNTQKSPHAKDAVGSNLICPRVALVDPQLTYGLPPALTASTGIDALCHAYEGYTALPASPYTDMYAEKAFALIAENLLPAYANGDNIDARRNMMLAQLFGAISFSNADTHANHALAEAIGGIYDIPHGVANAIFLPFVMDYLSIANLPKHAKMAQCFGRDITGLTMKEAADQAVDAVLELRDLLDIPTLQGVGVKEKDFGKIVDLAMANLGTPDSPRKMTPGGYLEILRNTYDDIEL